MRYAAFIFAGILLFGVVGYFIAGTDGRNLGGGIGAAVGAIAAGSVRRRG